MPKKIRELKKMLKKAGFSQRPGKGSHTNWTHPLYSGRITISGKDSQDAKPYQESEIIEAIEIVKEIENEQNE
jgi:predicted RNA binding protein YcfA (HicA-like mRNA interferase family)